MSQPGAPQPVPPQGQPAQSEEQAQPLSLQKRPVSAPEEQGFSSPGQPVSPEGEQAFSPQGAYSSAPRLPLPPPEPEAFAAQGQPFPPQGQPFPPHDPQAFPPQYPQHGAQWASQPPPRRGRGGVIALVLVLVVVVLGGGGVGAYLLFFHEDSNKRRVVDTSLDLADAPMGCGLFTEAEIARYIPGTFGMEPTNMLGGNRDYEQSAQCSYSNQKNRGRNQPAAWIIVTTRLHKANQLLSGVDKGKAELNRKLGSAVGVPEADDDKFREMESSRGNVNQAEITILYHNVTIHILYHYDGLGTTKFTQPLMELSSLALTKVTG